MLTNFCSALHQSLSKLTWWWSHFLMLRGGREHIFFRLWRGKEKSKRKVSPKNFEKVPSCHGKLEDNQIDRRTSRSRLFFLSSLFPHPLFTGMSKERKGIHCRRREKPTTFNVSAGFRRLLKAQKTLERQRRRKVGPKRRELKSKNKREGENVGENARLTCNVQVERWAGSLAFGVASVTCVASRRAARHSLQNQTRFADDHTGAHVVL